MRRGLSTRRRPHSLAAIAAALPLVLTLAAAGADCPIKFRDVTAETGIDFVHTHGGSGKKYIVETVSAGVATFDYDNDGKTDIYFVNGRPLVETETKVRPKNRLYRNLGNFKFQDVTDRAGVDGGASYGLGVCVGDYDNDGYQDLYLSNFGENVLYHNNGDGTFSDVTRKAGVGRGPKVGAGPVSWITTTTAAWTSLPPTTSSSPTRTTSSVPIADFTCITAPAVPCGDAQPVP